ncbi:hypothetical protein [Sedimentitalea todarodis]|uniref:Uncharacterized protein n=1 Tax=Sedimentitalea todarodis TaxID=1631240 RepID=A0ABU3VBF2_9RHOB|nr:hypothetical protein [Sedimentitalea todarodis]MDU9003506.1 hypothetical protein [Sedimentitalea todarodis]
MSNKLTGIALIAGLAFAIPQTGEAFTSKLGARVNQVNSAVFEVVPRSSGNGQVFWCSAADYAQRALRASWRARIYIARGRAPSVTTGRRSSVQFTLDPKAAGITPAPPSLSLNALNVGESMTVQEAYGYCQRSPIF